MKKEDEILQAISLISHEVEILSLEVKNISKNQEADRASFLEYQKANTEQLSGINNQLTIINNTLSHERVRLDSIYEERKEVQITWSRSMMAMNSAFAGIVAFVVSSFK